MGDAILSSYYSLYFIHNGLDAHQQSILLGMIPFCLFLGCFVLSRFARNGKATLWLFRACALIETGLTFGFAFCHNFVSLAVLTALLSFFNGAPFAFLESHSALAVEKGNIPYGRIRIFGTFGYIVSLLLGYFLLSNLPFSQCYFFSAGFFAIAFGLSFLAKPNEDEAEEKKEDKPQAAKGHVRAVVLLIVATVLMNGALGAATYLLPVRLNSLGLSDADYSIMRSLSIGAEAIMMLTIPFLHRFFKNKKIPFYIAIIGFTVSFLIMGFVQNPYLCGYLGLILTALAKAFVFSYEVYLFEEIVGKNALSRIFTIHNGLYNLLATGLNLSSSHIYLNAGFPLYFGILSGIEVIGLIVLFFLPVSAKAEPLA